MTDDERGGVERCDEPREEQEQCDCGEGERHAGCRELIEDRDDAQAVVLIYWTGHRPRVCKFLVDGSASKNRHPNDDHRGRNTHYGEHELANGSSL